MASWVGSHTAKSMPLGRLADHIAQIVGWITDSMDNDIIDLTGYQPSPEPSTTQEIVDRFDRNRIPARKALLQQPIRLFNGGGN